MHGEAAPVRCWPWLEARVLSRSRLGWLLAMACLSSQGRAPTPANAVICAAFVCALQVGLFDAFMELWWERVAPMWQERAELLSALQSRAHGSSGPAGGPFACSLKDEVRVLARLAALQSGLFLHHAVFELTFTGSILTSWQLCQGIALAQPYVPSFMAVDQGLRELRAARAARAAEMHGGGHGLAHRPN